MNDYFRRTMISLVLPFVFMVGFPIAAILSHDTNRITWFRAGLLPYLITIFGCFFIALGLVLFLHTIPLFLKQSKGTNMPWEPIPELIVDGVYRYVRNPMHTGVFAVMLGEGLILGSSSILLFTGFAIILHLFYIPFSEERGLENRFGKEYIIYKENVPRWIPRLSPWEPNENKTK
jgi:protein-S-isoprenylcysteine O-methyltransferase Ste14